MIGVKKNNKGYFKKTEEFLKKNMNGQNHMFILNKYGARGVELLRDATPVDTFKTASSWSYTIEQDRERYKINFINSNVIDGVNIAIILQYGHGTRNGGYVVGTDYINPALKTAFEEMRDELVREVRRS